MNLQELQKAFHTRFGYKGAIKAVRAPGRINLIGEHTDYNNGFVLPVTLNKGVTTLIRERRDRRCIVHSINYFDTQTFELDEIHRTGPVRWIDYVKGVTSELVEAGHINNGYEALIWGDIPPDSGMSSSAAVEVSLFKAIQLITGFKMAPLQAVKLCQRAENNFVGVKCGVMDQYASLLGKSGHAKFIDCRSLESEDVPLNLDKYAILTIDSKIERKLMHSEYNRRREESEEALDYFKKKYPNVHSLRDVTLKLLETGKGSLADNLYRRVEHVINENKRVLDSVKDLKSNDMMHFGELMSASHASLRDLYEVSLEQIDFLVSEVMSHDGAVGSRMTGGGFGGSVISVVKTDKIQEIISRVEENYYKKYALEAEFYLLLNNIECETILG